MDADLKSLELRRAEIDRIDDEILSLIQQREACVVEIAKIKRAMSDSPQYHVPEREKAIIERITSGYNGRFPVSVIADIFQQIIKQCRLLQGKDQ